MLTDWRSTINLRNCCTYAQNIIIMLMSIDSYWPFHYHHRRIDSIASPPSKNIYFHVCLWPFKNKSDMPDFSDFVCLFQFDGALAQPTSSSSLPSPIQPALNAYICNFLNLIIFLFFCAREWESILANEMPFAFSQQQQQLHFVCAQFQISFKNFVYIKN